MAMKKAFEEFLDEQLQEQEETEIDWDELKSDWINNINSFYKMVVGLLDEYIKLGKITFEYVNYIAHEENLGSYDTKKLIITLGQQQVSFIPIGRLIFGAQGRIDMKGALGKVIFIFTEHRTKNDALAISLVINGKSVRQTSQTREETLPNWKISSPPPNHQYIDINDETFFNALMEVVNG